MGKGLNSCKRTNQEYGVCLPAPKSATEGKLKYSGVGFTLFLYGKRLQACCFESHKTPLGDYVEVSQISLPKARSTDKESVVGTKPPNNPGQRRLDFPESVPLPCSRPRVVVAECRGKFHRDHSEVRRMFIRTLV